MNKDICTRRCIASQLVEGDLTLPLEFLAVEHATAVTLTLAAKEGVSLACLGCKTPLCCSDPVVTFSGEAKFIFDYCEAKQIPLENRLAQWERSFRAAGINPSSCSREEYRRQETPCPFLEDSNCAIYEVRPVACIVHLATGELSDCHDFYKGHRELQSIISDTMILLQISDYIPNTIQGLALNPRLLPVELLAILSGESGESLDISKWEPVTNEEVEALSLLKTYCETVRS